MPPRFTYWTIILDGQPTAFRAAERDQLLPTLKQLRSKNPAAVLKWFAHGRLWESPEEVWQVRLKAREAARDAAQRDRRGRDWRPGGEHKDPRERFKKETFQARKRRDRKAANLAGTDVARPPSRERFGETGGPVAAARVLSGRRSPACPPKPGLPAEAQRAKAGGQRREGEGGSPAKDAAPGRPAPSHKSRMPRLRKPR